METAGPLIKTRCLQQQSGDHRLIWNIPPTNQHSDYFAYTTYSAFISEILRLRSDLGGNIERLRMHTFPPGDLIP